ncbi:Glucan 1,4-alpha-glucosidase, partial [mine drainage metagenome]
ELVRYGIRDAKDPLIEDSLKVVDALLKVETPAGPCWKRYNHDGYGQRADGSPYSGWGQGRPWPLLVGERGHYELKAGRDVQDYIRTMERFASPMGLLPEQVWDGPDLPACRLRPGGVTGAAMPLMWAHAEYLKLLRSALDGAVFDEFPEVAERYLQNPRPVPIEIWKPNRRIRQMVSDRTLRILAPRPFRLRWSLSGWKEIGVSRSHPTTLGVEYVDL